MWGKWKWQDSLRVTECHSLEGLQRPLDLNICEKRRNRSNEYSENGHSEQLFSIPHPTPTPYKCMWRPKVSVMCLFLSLSILIFETLSLTERNPLIGQTGWTEYQGSSCVHLPSPGIVSACCCAPGFAMSNGDPDAGPCGYGTNTLLTDPPSWPW